MNLNKDTLPEQRNNDNLGSEKITRANINENETKQSESAQKLSQNNEINDSIFPISKDENIVELTQEDYNIIIHSLFEYKNTVEKQQNIIENLKASFDNLNRKMNDLNNEVNQRMQKENDLNQSLEIKGSSIVSSIDIIKEINIDN